MSVAIPCQHACKTSALYLFYGSYGDDKEERQTAGDWTGGRVDDKLARRERGGETRKYNHAIQ